MLVGPSMTRLIFVSLACARFGNAAIPELLWSRTLPNSGTIEGEGLRRGNAVVLSDDQQSLWLTTETGTLHVYDTDGKAIKKFRPDTTVDRYTESRSSVSLYQPEYLGQSIVYAVYAVIDVPHHGENGTRSDEISSRIISVNGGSSGEVGTLRWSTFVQGAIEGTPLISSDGTKIFVIHNTRYWAHLTVLESTAGTIISETVDVRPMVKYGPASLVTIDGVDHLYWADAHDMGYALGGHVYTMKSTDFTAVHSPQSFPSSTTVTPTLSKNAKLMWLGGRAATVHAWGENSTYPLWSTQLNRSLRNASYPIVNRIETDDAEERVFVSSASNSFHCIDAQNGNLLWSAKSSASIFLTGAKYSPTYDVVYSIEHLSGTVTQHDAKTGVINWKFDCRDIGQNKICYDSVEADFALSSKGTILYYGDVYGRINAVVVAVETPCPSDAPSSQPSSAPSSTPSQMPSQLPSQLPSSAPSSTPSQMPSKLPSQLPSSVPTQMPSTTQMPSQLPSSVPTQMPSQLPSSVPTEPSSAPSSTPSQMPSLLPSSVPTEMSATPPSVPSGAPTLRPTTSGAEKPTPQNKWLTSDPTSGREATPWPTSKPVATPLPSNIPTVSAARTRGIWISTFVFISVTILFVVY